MNKFKGQVCCQKSVSEIELSERASEINNYLFLKIQLNGLDRVVIDSFVVAIHQATRFIGVPPKVTLEAVPVT